MSYHCMSLFALYKLTISGIVFDILFSIETIHYGKQPFYQKNEKLLTAFLADTAISKRHLSTYF